MSDFRILDLTAGNRAIWFDRTYRDAIFVDIRPEVLPDIVADTCALPAQLGDDFDLVVFDPPHENYGANGFFAKNYGHFTLAQIRQTIIGTAKEAHRVTRRDALMAFKWSSHAWKLQTALDLLKPYWEPLFGHGVTPATKRARMTSWVMLRRMSGT